MTDQGKGPEDIGRSLFDSLSVSNILMGLCKQTVGILRTTIVRLRIHFDEWPRRYIEHQASLYEDSKHDFQQTNTSGRGLNHERES